MGLVTEVQDRQGQTMASRRNAELQRDIRPKRSATRFHKVGTPGNQEIVSKRDEDRCLMPRTLLCQSRAL